MTDQLGIFPDSDICWCCGNEYDSRKKRCRRPKLGHPCELMGRGKCKTRSIEMRNFGHCKGRIKKKSWGLKRLKIKKFKSVEKRLRYFDKKLNELGLRDFALMNEWKDKLIEIVISDV